MIDPTQVLKDAFGAPDDTALGKLVNRSRSAVTNWRLAKRVPAERLLRFQALARERGIELPPELFERPADDNSAVTEPPQNEAAA